MTSPSASAAPETASARSAYEGAASDSFDDLAHLGVAEAKQEESSALVPEKW